MSQPKTYTNVFNRIFKNGSKTYYYSSLFFDRETRTSVTILYAFVRSADDFVDSTPQDKEGFYAFRRAFEEQWKGKTQKNQVITEFVTLAKKHAFDYSWIDSFLNAMEQDLSKKKYESIDQTLSYMYGSAEVVGLMMAKLLKLPQESFEGAKMLGRSMQYINFIRDIQEDITLGRQYIPSSDLERFGLNSLNFDHVKKHPQAFANLIELEINHYFEWLKEAEKAFHYIPLRYRIPIQTASSMYTYTAKTIKKNPFIVYEIKIKPSIIRLLTTGLYHTMKGIL